MPPGEPLRVRMGEYVVRGAEEAPGGLSICGLGSCVAVFLHEKHRRVGGLAHILLPEPDVRSPLTSPGKFAPTAVAGMLDELLQRGGCRRQLLAKVAGGAHMFTHGASQRKTLGERNIRAALEALERESIEVVAMDIGGSYGRTIVADVATGMMRITSLKREPRRI